MLHSSLLAAAILLAALPALAAGKETAGPVEGPIFVETAPLALPLLGEPGGRSGIISIALTLEVADAEAKTLVDTQMPKLTDAWLASLYGRLEQRGIVERGVLNLQRLKAEIEQTSADVLGEGVVTHVLVQTVMRSL